jgi:hypothetical protein
MQLSKKRLVTKKKIPVQIHINVREATVQNTTIKPPQDFIFYFL